MAADMQDQGTITKYAQETHLLTWLEGFLIDRKAQNMSAGTVIFYRQKLCKFAAFCESLAITQITEITPTTLREYLLFLEQKGHNPGGIHAHFRTLRAFLNWWEIECEPSDWRNPIKKVKAPKVGIDPLEPVDFNSIKAILDACDQTTFTGTRDKALILVLLDTGSRAGELLRLNVDDIDLVSGAVLIREGKGHKPRMVYVGKKTRHAIRAYLKQRQCDHTALWITIDSERLTYWGLRQMIRRRAAKAGIPEPSLHSFRRAFAINMLRAGVDVFSLQKLMGHSDLQVLRRYLAQTTEDIARAHRIGSPVDNNKL
jgi:integrase/recombinase XerD